MIETIDKNPWVNHEKPVKKPTIPEISDAIADLLKWKNIESQELKNSIKEMYDLIEVIRTKLPSLLKEKLFLGPTSEKEVIGFVKDLKNEYPDKEGWEQLISKTLDKYLDFFERWWEWRQKQWKKILGNYNPNRINNLM